MTDAPVAVDVNTDDLSDFNSLLYGKAEQAPAKEVTPAKDTGAPEDNELDEDVLDDLDDAAGDGQGGDDDGEDGDKPADDADILKPRKKQSVQERINELTRKVHEAERRAIAAETASKAVPKADPVDAPVRKPVAPTFDPAAPNPAALDDAGNIVYPLGEFDPKFIADLTSYTYDVKDRETQARRANETRAAATLAEDTARAAQWTEKLTKSQEELPDLLPTIASLDVEFAGLEPTFGTYLAKTIMDMDLGPEVLFYLANNVEEARTIVASGPARATVALGRLEGRIQSALSKGKATPAVRVTNAPKPAAVSRGTSGSSGSARPDTDDLAAFERQFYKST